MLIITSHQIPTDSPRTGTQSESSFQGDWISGFPHWFWAYLCAFLGFYNRNGFIWGLKPEPPPSNGPVATHDNPMRSFGLLIYTSMQERLHVSTDVLV